ncbi:hypothetical protein OB931_18985 [Aeromonas media]|uniref:hypothetical protein n=1 Tax=Aeromonas media TaxID=651 RepID=UPI0024C2058D|nr:hypothetical protein [Aeromonas media]MDM5078435.1 hypothetical protein [Aeromonas media]
MEASDDISYCISDIEDGLEKGIITFEHFKTHVHSGFKRILSGRDAHCKYKKLLEALSPQDGSPIGAFLSFKTRLQNLLVEDVAEIFVKDYYEFIDFKVNSEIICKGTLQYDLLKILKVYTGDYLFSSSEAEKLELSGFSIISGILEEYQKLLALDKDKFSYLVANDADMIKEYNLSLHRRLYNRLPSKHVKAYVAALLNCPISPNVDKYHFSKEVMMTMPSVSHEIEWNLRAHLIVDFVSGMTDQFSMEFFQMLKGINVN